MLITDIGYGYRSLRSFDLEKDIKDQLERRSNKFASVQPTLEKNKRRKTHVKYYLHGSGNGNTDGCGMCLEMKLYYEKLLKGE